jgi:hypothetical protein
MKYASDCLRIVKYVLNRVPWSSNETSQVMELSAMADHIWKSEFNREITTDHFYRSFL